MNEERRFDSRPYQRKRNQYDNGKQQLTMQRFTEFINTASEKLAADLVSALRLGYRRRKEEGTVRSGCRHRRAQSLNNIIEQDHRPIKRRVNAKQGFCEFQAARRTISGL